MLNKSVCKLCLSKQPCVNGVPFNISSQIRRKFYSKRTNETTGRIEFTNEPCGWNQNDEKLWKEGFVHCPMITNSRKIKIIDFPPHFCPYVLEHILIK